METPYNPQPAQPKNNMPLIIGIAVAVALCCCCIVALVLVPALMGPSVGNVFSRINEDLDQPQQLPQVPDQPGSSSDSIPTGGLGNDILRRDIWNNILNVSESVGCTPVGPDTVYISVTQDIAQDADGNQTWAETWSVLCDSSDYKDFHVEYTQDSTGVSFRITSDK